MLMPTTTWRTRLVWFDGNGASSNKYPSRVLNSDEPKNSIFPQKLLILIDIEYFTQTSDFKVIFFSLCNTRASATFEVSARNFAEAHKTFPKSPNCCCRQLRALSCGTGDPNSYTTTQYTLSFCCRRNVLGSS